MKLGLTTLLALALAALLLVPAAGAKPGNGNGNGNGNGQGRPAWAGGGKPDQAEKDAWKAAKREAKAERRAARAAAPDDALEPKHQNPAWICKFEREQMGAEAFAEEYGLNDNKANAFGKCVSREAHDRDGVTAGDDEAPAPDDDEPTEPEAPVDEGDPSAAAQAFFAYLWPFLQA